MQKETNFYIVFFKYNFLLKQTRVLWKKPDHKSGAKKKMHKFNLIYLINGWKKVSKSISSYMEISKVCYGCNSLLEILIKKKAQISSFVDYISDKSNS